MATFNAELQRDGPGLLLRDILSGDDPKVIAAARLVVGIAPDILVLTGIDFDHDGHALAAFAAGLSALGHDYPHRFARQPNTGLPTGRDIDGDGRANGARDAQGFGEFAGQAGMAILSRHPIDTGGVRDFSAFLWADLPGALIGDDPAADLQRLSTTAHWDVPVDLPGGMRVHILAYYATPPVFDGPEDRNGRRNHDETAFWTHYLDGTLSAASPPAAFVIAGDANLDPADGDGRGAAMAALLAHPRVQDPRPSSPEGAARAARNGGVNALHGGDPALDTADWPDGPGGPGNLRVDYVLPSRDWRVADAGIAWPPSDSGLRHGLVWVDLLPEGAGDSDVDGGLDKIRR
ncbi:endonuclease/exonuclease/phosphatase family protein [Palleronia sp. KMU-117]|uniref:endonuclease/exonuclease/phosphatase family protein n=1 Tax=Palleronia sp. KMU-117 TaxID=3434108 RepID=UPI003D7054A2